MTALPPCQSSSRPKHGECQGYVFQACDRDERDFHWSLEDVESSSDINAKLNALDFSIPVNPEMPYFYPSMIILVSAFSTDVELRRSAKAWHERKKIYLAKWVIGGEVSCEWTEDPKDNGGSNWNIKVTKNYRGQPTLASLGIVDPTSTDSRTVSTASCSRDVGIEQLEERLESLTKRFSELLTENQTLKTSNEGLAEENMDLREHMRKIPLSLRGMVLSMASASIKTLQESGDFEEALEHD